MWIAGAILGLTLAGACSLNPQPLPPQGLDDHAGDDGSSPMGTGSGSSSGTSGGSGFMSSSGSNSGGSGAGPVVSDDAGAVVSLDASAEDSGVIVVPPVDAATDAAVPSDSGGSESDGASPDGSPDASPDGAVDASPDGAVDDASTGDAAGDAGCAHATDCYLSHPGACSVCTWPLNYPVCVAHQCGCACDERDASGE
jgi:hypothetical protein